MIGSQPRCQVRVALLLCLSFHSLSSPFVLPVQAGVSVRHAVAAILVTAVLLHLSTVTRQGCAIAPPAQSSEPVSAASAQGTARSRSWRANR